MEQQHCGGVHAQLRRDLFEQDGEGQAQVEAGADGPVIRVQRLDVPEAALGLLVQRHAVNSICGNVGNRGEQAQFIGGDLRVEG